tara:strand:+ start:998 stop:1219 length:222 start_codon:yes stop_codon:yes gene_type:complete
MNPKTQKEAVLDHLQQFQTITSLEAIKEFGATRLSDIIFRLRKEGYNIESLPFVRKNRFGNTVTLAKYFLNEK